MGNIAVVESNNVERKSVVVDEKIELLKEITLNNQAKIDRLEKELKETRQVLKNLVELVKSQYRGIFDKFTVSW